MHLREERLPEVAAVRLRLPTEVAGLARYLGVAWVVTPVAGTAARFHGGQDRTALLAAVPAGGPSVAGSRARATATFGTTR